MKNHNFSALILLVFFISCFEGCITSGVRYTRPSSRRNIRQKEKDAGKASVKETEKSNIIEGPKSKLKSIVDSYIGVRYRYGGVTRRGMDCSGFVWRVYKDLGRNDLKRESSEILYRTGKQVRLRNAKVGDLVFFRRWRRINHVGIYMGNNTFAHASSKYGVKYTSLDNEYFSKRFAGVRRLY